MATEQPVQPSDDILARLEAIERRQALITEHIRRMYGGERPEMGTKRPPGFTDQSLPEAQRLWDELFGTPEKS